MRDDQFMTPWTDMKQVWLWFSIVLAAFGSGLLGCFALLSINGAAGDPVVRWIGDWMKSPGFTGLSAIIAAGIAFVGISLQMNATRLRDADAAWWQSFEWASDRGLPRDRTAKALPPAAALDTLNALASAARTDIQKNAVGGVVEEVIRRGSLGQSNEDPAAIDSGSPPASGTDAITGEPEVADGDQTRSEDFSSAIWRYAAQQVGTAAESRRAAASAYETEVLRALRHQFERVVPVRGNAPGDVIVDTRQRSLVVEIKWAPGLVLSAGRITRLNGVDVVISNVQIKDLEAGIRAVVWDARKGSRALRRALEKIDE